MLTSYIFTAVVALATGVNAQQPTESSSTSPAEPSSSGKVVEIAVGADPHKFTPETVEAKVGDIIRFNFYPGGHRVSRSEWKLPCIPYENTGANRKGFFSGVFNPQTITLPHPHYDVRVNDTNPIYFYCGAPGSCFEYGMVGIVNPWKNQTFKEFQQQALDASFQLLPGEPWPSETVAAPTPSNTGAPTGGSTDKTPEPTPQPSSGGSSLSSGAIAGIAIGGAAVLILGAALVYLCGRRGGFDKAYRKSITVNGPGGSEAGAAPSVMAEQAKYGGPKSPGQATVSTFPGHHDPYRVSAQSPHAQHFGNGTPPPLSPGLNSGYSTYGGTLAPGAHYPLMGDVQNQHVQHTPPPIPSPQFHPPPVELPSSDHHHPTPVHSPPPQYPQAGDRDSWTTGQEVNYRAGKP